MANQPPKTKEEEVEEVVIKPLAPVDARFRDLISELILSVTDGMFLSEAKLNLHRFVEDLSADDKTILYPKATAVATRIRDIATSLTSETPSLLVKMQP